PQARVMFAAAPPLATRERYDVAAEWKYNVVTCGPRSEELMRRLGAPEMYLSVNNLLDEVHYLQRELCDVRDRLLKHGVDPTQSNIAPRGRSTTGQKRLSAREWAIRRVPKQDRPAVSELVAEFDRLRGHLQQLTGAAAQVQGKADALGDVAIRTTIARIVNRRYQATTFWPTEITAKSTSLREVESSGWDVGDDEIEWSIEEVRRSRLFRLPAHRSLEERQRIVEERQRIEEDRERIAEELLYMEESGKDYPISLLEDFRNTGW